MFLEVLDKVVHAWNTLTWLKLPQTNCNKEEKNNLTLAHFFRSRENISESLLESYNNYIPLHGRNGQPVWRL